MTRILTMGLAASAIALTPACAQDGVDTASKEAIEKVVYDYIMENPEIIEEALYALQDKREAERNAEIATKVADKREALVSNPDDYFVGPADAPVTVVEFFDYRCGFCKRSASWAVGLSEKYDNKVRVVFKEFPILSAESEKAALAALAAGKQGKYIEMHMALMELDNGSGFGPEQIDAAAESIGIDVAKMHADMKSVEVQTAVANSKSLAREIGLDGTPNFIIGTNVVPGADIASVERYIEEALAES